MAKVAFWSPENKMTGNTHSILAVSTFMGIKYKAKCLLMQAHFNSKKIETSFTPYDELKDVGTFTSSNVGIGALTKIVVSNKLTSTSIKNYAKPLLKDRLDILYGVMSKEKEQYDIAVNNLQYIMRKADEIYDLVFVDLPKDSEEKHTKDVLTDSDLVVCTLNQDTVKLEEFFEEVRNNKSLKDKKILYLLSDYEDKSKYNVNNIRNAYRIKEPILVVPHNIMFSDACNDGMIIDFFYRNMNNADKNDYNGKFIYEVDRILTKVIELTGIKDYQ